MRTLNRNRNRNTKLYHSIKNADAYIFEQCLNFDNLVDFEALRREIENNDVINLASQRYQRRTLAAMLKCFKRINNL